MKKTIIGIDLAEDYSQVSYYNDRSMEVETISVPDQEKQFLIPTPEDLFQVIHSARDLGIMSLANFLKHCISLIKPKPQIQTTFLMVTMNEICQPWIDGIKRACEMLGFEKEQVFLQSYRESFYYYVMNQKRELWVHNSSLFIYDKSKIFSYVMKIDNSTRPALVTVCQKGEKDLGYAVGRSEEEWDERRDQRFLELIRETFQDETASSAFLIGDDFDKSWAVESLQVLCRKRHVYQGRNLFTKGACYGACARLHTGKNLDAYLYQSEDLILQNLRMQMEIRGKNSNYLLIGAGINWYEAEHTCEFLMDDTNEVLIYGKHMITGELSSYSIVLDKLPKRPVRTTRLQLHADFLDAGRCRIFIRDLGFGEFYPASGLTWESILSM